MLCLPHMTRPVLAVRPRAAAVHHGHDLVRPTIVAEDVGHSVLHLRPTCPTEQSVAATLPVWRVRQFLACGERETSSSVQIRPFSEEGNLSTAPAK